jgi:hypothetical protein
MDNGYDWIHEFQKVLDYDHEKPPVAYNIGWILVLFTGSIVWRM